ASDDGCLYALSLADGRLLWKHRGGPNDRMCLGNGRMISRWPARGGPVVLDDAVYFAAGIWPSDGVFLHALDAKSGNVLWTNDGAGGLYMPQPHGGANAHSGVTPQGYLLADRERLFVPTGRAVPAAFNRSDGQFEHYLLQQNGSMGGSRAIAAEGFLINGGCFLEKQTGKLAARAGRGVFSASPHGVLRSTGQSLLAYRWADLEEPDRKGKPVEYRGLQKHIEVALADATPQERQAEGVLQKLPVLADLYRTRIRFKEAFDNVPKQTGLERTLSQSRPDVVALGGNVDPFLAATYERRYELIQAADEAVCGGAGVVRVVDLGEGRVRWSHQVEGNALGLAAAEGHLIVSTTSGSIYCFGPPVEKPAVQPSPPAATPTTPPEIDYAQAADEILRRSGLNEGICLDLGSGTGQLALELLRKSNLRVIGLESDPEKVAQARRRLDAAGLYGVRVSVHQGDPAKPPFSRHCANLIVSSRGLLGESVALDQTELDRLQRPYGGVVCLGKPGQFEIDRRGPLEGAGQWTHQNCDPANTLCSTDRVVRGPLEVAWFGAGVLEIPDRHAQGPAPLFMDGCLVVEGVDGLCALDAYNGHTLWTYPIEAVLADWDGVHHDVGVGDTGSNFCLGHNAVFVRTDDRCLKIDLHSGKKLFEVRTPVEPSARDQAWGYIACSDGLLFGSVANDEHTISPRYKGIRLRNESVLLFAMDAKTGKLKWQFKPKHSLRNNAIAVAGGRVYLIDRPIALADRITEPTPNGKHRPLLKPGEHPGGSLIALDAATGNVVWKTDDDVFGTQIAVSQPHGVLLMHYQAVKHSFFKLPSEIGGRLAAFDLATGSRRWDRPAVFTTRPWINDEVIYAEGGAWNLLTGEPVPWKFERSYGCGQIAASTHLMLFRSATLGYLDLTRDVGTENFGGIRPGCWFSAVPAGGLVLVPDGSSKCACSYQTRAWLALQPRR
ncbi:MAG: PQQ-binding-like beta-propeller repeat protein, partial [Planctomycetes bacterium]|nr:PQQ-binding-like beta-propeller repeat protein [Planctomycetota bacterium]